MIKKRALRASAGRRTVAIVSLLIVSVAAGCTSDRGQEVKATGTAAPAPAETTTTAVPPTTVPASIEVPETTVTVPPLPPATLPRLTTTSRPRPRLTTTTLPKTPPVTTVRRPVAYAAATGSRPDYGYVIPITAAGTAGERIPVGGTPKAIAITPDGASALVTNYSGYVSVIDTATSKLRATIPACNAASGIAITPDGKTAFVTCEYPNTVQPINLATWKTEDSIPVGYNPIGIVITPDGKTVYVVNFNGNSLSEAQGSVTPISVATRTVGRSIALGGPEAESAAITPDGRTLIVGVRDYGGHSSIHYIDTASTTDRPIRPDCQGPSGIAISPDGTHAYIACRFNIDIIEVNLARPTEVARKLPIGSWAVALSPAGAVLYSAGGAVGGSTVDIIDTATMKSCGYIAADGPAAVAAVPGLVPDVGCVPKP